jgi:hypothetical protein
MMFLPPKATPSFFPAQAEPDGDAATLPVPRVSLTYRMPSPRRRRATQRPQRGTAWPMRHRKPYAASARPVTHTATARPTATPAVPRRAISP